MNRQQIVAGGRKTASGAKRQGPIPLSRARSLIPFLEFGYQHRLSVDRWLRECQLPDFLHEDPDCFIPTSARWSYISLMARESGRDDLGLRIAFDNALDMIGPRVLHRVLRSSTLEQGIDEFRRCITGESSGTAVTTSQQRGTATLNLKRTFGQSTPGFRQTEWQSLIVLVKIVQLFAGRRWQPEKMSLRSSQPLPPLAAGLFPDVRFLVNQNDSSISFSIDLLGLGPCDYASEVAAKLEPVEAGVGPIEVATDFPDSLRRLLATYSRDGYPSLALFSGIAGISARTMQRRLSDHGLCFSRLVERVRFDVAARLLRLTDASSLEIAFEIGYEDPSNFARAFRRLAGCSPREYRSQLAA